MPDVMGNVSGGNVSGGNVSGAHRTARIDGGVAGIETNPIPGAGPFRTSGGRAATNPRRIVLDLDIITFLVCYPRSNPGNATASRSGASRSRASRSGVGDLPWPS
jgi:hypothetical protein